MSALPDFLIIGAQKAGTTAAARNLSLHAGLRMFSGTTEYGQKEIEFFNQHWERGTAWYASHFHKTATLNGEKTAELLHRIVCHERMFAVNPHFKLIVLLRSPVERAYSQWKMATFMKKDEYIDFDEVIRRELDVLDDSEFRDRFYACFQNEMSCWREGYLLKGMYAEQLQSLYSWFPKEQVFIGIAERIRNNMVAGYRDIYRFLGLDPIPGPYSEHFISQPGPAMSQRTRSLMSEVYRRPNEQLYCLLGMEIPEWG